jgi:hypothetical protein
MPKGKPSKWASVKINEPIHLTKRGMKITIWDKYGRTHRGYCTVSIGGIRWTPYGKQKAFFLRWDGIEEAVLKRKR